MALYIRLALLDTILRHAEEDYPDECCGILIGRRNGAEARVERVVRAENIAGGDRRKNYQLDWRTLLNSVRRVRNEGSRIVGFYHSHPDGTTRPSRRDRESAWVDHSYVIVTLVDRSCTAITSWRTPGNSDPFEEEPTIVMRTSCTPKSVRTPDHVRYG